MPRIRRPVEALLREYEQAYGGRTQVQDAGSGTLLANLVFSTGGTSGTLLGHK